MPESQINRQIAYKVPIDVLLKNPYIEQEGWNPNYVQVNGKQISRINLIATVVDKQASESLISLTLDDSTGKIQAKAFNEAVRKVMDINIGDPVLLIARPRKYNQQLFLNIEIIRRVDPLWTKVRKTELKKEFSLNEAPLEIDSSLSESGSLILDLIKEIDSGDGADLNQILIKSGLNEKKALSVIEELIKLGEIYEPKPNKIKILG